ncbi:hypothetical protein DEO72_LG10g1468 [Vigna unguiculata]|uniref:Uncharacterized protein n=1 Tax=Vigna unguiculata TaxID=3917 RepID=A0A4D6N8T4_VIGUN|nr:hypothetical protein DEO72_LG10g1467 [Vigna unguiculata]QCE10240.1 hypothetical protein DEO72_LG10g1468 [Vigna unguiculata]
MADNGLNVAILNWCMIHIPGVEIYVAITGSHVALFPRGNVAQHVCDELSFVNVNGTGGSVS